MLIAVASLGLRPLLPLMVGIAATVVTIAFFVTAWVLEPQRIAFSQFSDWNDGHISPVRALVLGTALLAGGALGAQVAAQSRRVLERSLTTLTFLFADLRGFTDFVERHGDDAGARLVRDYREVVRAMIRRWGGRELKTEGSSADLLGRLALRSRLGRSPFGSRRSVTNDGLAGRSRSQAMSRQDAATHPISDGRIARHR